MALTRPSLTVPPPQPLFSMFKPKPLTNRILSQPLTLSLALSSTAPLSLKNSSLLASHDKRRTKNWEVLASPEEALPSDASAVDSSSQIVSTGDDGVGTIVSALLFIAFIALSILTVGVIYIAVQDFLQKREREKFEKEEASKKKKGGKKGKVVRARTGPRGFGQKIDEDDVGDD